MQETQKVHFTLWIGKNVQMENNKKRLLLRNLRNKQKNKKQSHSNTRGNTEGKSGRYYGSDSADFADDWEKKHKNCGGGHWTGNVWDVQQLCKNNDKKTKDSD